MKTWLKPELQALADALHRGKACGHKGQAQNVLYHAHLVQHGFYAGWIAVDEKQVEQVGKLMVYLARAVYLAVHLKPYHA